MPGHPEKPTPSSSKATDPGSRRRDIGSIADIGGLAEAEDMAQRTIGIELGDRARGALVERAVVGSAIVDVPSVVGVGDDGAVVVGEGAVALQGAVAGFVAQLGRAEPFVVRGTPYGAEALTAQLLRSVFDAAAVAAGTDAVVATALVHEDDWNEYQLDLLREAVRLAAVGPVHLVPATVARSYDADDLAVGAARWAWAQQEDGGGSVPVSGAPVSARTVLLGAGAGTALALGGGAVAAGAAGGAGGSALGDFATPGSGSTLGDFAGTGGSSLGDLADGGGSSLGDFADGGGATLGDFADKGGSRLGDFAASPKASTPPPTPVSPPKPPGRRLGKVPAAIGAAVVAVGVVAGVALASTNGGDDDAPEQAAATTTTDADADATTTTETAGPTTTAGELTERMRTPYLFACGGDENIGVGDGGPAKQASCGRPVDVAVLPDGTVYFADNHVRASDGASRVRVVDADGTIDSIEFGEVDGKPLDSISSMAVAPDGTIYLADPDHHRILRRSPTGTVTRFAGNAAGDMAGSVSTGTPIPIGDGVPAASSPIGSPSDLALAPDGSLWFGDTHNSIVQRVDTSGTLSTEITGRGPRSSTEDGPVPLKEANLVGLLPASTILLEFDPQGRLHVGDEKYLYRVENGALVHVAGNGEWADDDIPDGVGGPATEAPLGLYALTFGPDGTLYIAAGNGVGTVRTIDASGIVRHFLGDETPSPSNGPTATRWSPAGLAVGRDGTLFVAEAGTSYEMVRRVPPGGLTPEGQPRTP
jgi:hypothetical protein